MYISKLRCGSMAWLRFCVQFYRNGGYMISKLKIIPLGGLGEIGKNMTAYEFGSDIIVVDCGMGFPDEDMYGIDIVLPDISYLKANADRIRGLILTHGHEDHIGAVPYVLKDLDIPIYTTPLTAALVELKLEEHDLLYNTQIFTKKAGSVFRLGCFTIEFIHVNHSIPDSVALAIGTPLGTVIHTGDFKIDVTPISGGASWATTAFSPCSATLPTWKSPDTPTQSARWGRASTSCSWAATSASSSPPLPPTCTGSSRL